MLSYNAGPHMEFFGDSFSGGIPGFEEAGSQSVSVLVKNNPLFSILTGILVFGCVLLVAGIALTVVLRRKRK